MPWLTIHVYIKIKAFRICILHQRSKLIATHHENVCHFSEADTLRICPALVLRVPVWSWQYLMMWGHWPPQLQAMHPGRCSLAAPGSQAQPNSAQSLLEIVLCTAVHCCRRLQRMLHSAMNSVPSPGPGLCPRSSGGQSSLPHCPDPFHINNKMYTNGAAVCDRIRQL